MIREKLDAIRERRNGVMNQRWDERMNGSLRLIVAPDEDGAVVALIGEAWTPGLTQFLLNAREDIDALLAEVEAD